MPRYKPRTSYKTDNSLIEKEIQNLDKNIIRWMTYNMNRFIYDDYNESKIRYIPLSHIRQLDPGWSISKVNDIKKSMVKNKNIPPIAVFRTKNGNYNLIDGTHRTLASRANGFTHIPAIFVTVTRKI